MQLENKAYQLIQTYYKQKYFISTAYRRASVSCCPDMWYFETIVWEWNKETRETGRMLEQDDSGSSERVALKNHFSLIEKLDKVKE